MDSLKVKDKVALITGGTSGMGRATALLFAREGMHLAINYSRNDGVAESLMRELEAFPAVRKLLVKGDVADYPTVEQMVRQVAETMGRLDILAHYAGIAQPKEKRESPENWDRVMRVHLYSCYNLGSIVAPVMRARGDGRIIIAASIAAHECYSNAYSVAMAGKICYAKGLARDLAPHNITVNTVSPGTIFTPMLDPFIPADKRRSFTAEHIPLYRSRKGVPAGGEIARVALFLASDLGRHVTGEDIKVDGGQFIHC